MTDFTCDHATHSSNGHPLFDLSNKLLARISARRQRRALAALTDLDEHLLNDVGLTRHDVENTLAQPLSVDVTTELHRLAYLNASSRM